MSVEKRDKERVLLLYDVKYGANGKLEHSSIITSFTDKGAQIKSNDALYPVGTKLKMVIEKDFSSYIAEGVVVWSKSVPEEQTLFLDYGMGISFTKIEEKVGDLYREYTEEEKEESKQVLL
jgi:hypothetical protein